MPQLDRTPESLVYCERDRRADGGVRTVRLDSRGVRIEARVGRGQDAARHPDRRLSRRHPEPRGQTRAPILSPQPRPPRRRSFGNPGARQMTLPASSNNGAIGRDFSPCRRCSMRISARRRPGAQGAGQTAAGSRPRQAPARPHAQARHAPCCAARSVPRRINSDSLIAAVQVEQGLASRPDRDRLDLPDQDQMGRHFPAFDQPAIEGRQG